MLLPGSLPSDSKYLDVEEERSWTRARLIGCGCLLTLLVALACTGGTCHSLLGEAVVSDPARVEQIADRILPGAVAPAGYRGGVASRLGLWEYASLQRPDGTGMRFHLLGQMRKKEVSEARWQEFSEQQRTFPGSWSDEVESWKSEQMVDGRRVLARRFVTEDEELGYRFLLSTRDRTVLLTVLGPRVTFEEKVMRNFLYRLDLDREPCRASIAGFPLWLLGLFGVLGCALLTVGFYIATELRGEGFPEDVDTPFEL